MAIGSITDLSFLRKRGYTGIAHDSLVITWLLNMNPEVCRNRLDRSVSILSSSSVLIY